MSHNIICQAGENLVKGRLITRAVHTCKSYVKLCKSVTIANY